VPNKRDHFTLLDLQVDVTQRSEFSTLGGEGLSDSFDLQCASASRQIVVDVSSIQGRNGESL
jgi:hypothetical protein